MIPAIKKFYYRENSLPKTINDGKRDVKSSTSIIFYINQFIDYLVAVSDITLCNSNRLSINKLQAPAVVLGGRGVGPGKTVSSQFIIILLLTLINTTYELS